MFLSINDNFSPSFFSTSVPMFTALWNRLFTRKWRFASLLFLSTCDLRVSVRGFGDLYCSLGSSKIHGTNWQITWFIYRSHKLERGVAKGCNKIVLCTFSLTTFSLHSLVDKPNYLSAGRSPWKLSPFLSTRFFYKTCNFTWASLFVTFPENEPEAFAKLSSLLPKRTD